MSPLRWDVLGVALLLALPVLALGLRGDLSTQEVAVRLPWCLLGGWIAVALVRFVGTPRHPAGGNHAHAQHQEPAADEEPTGS